MVLEAAMSMKLHRIGTVTPRTHDLLVKTPWVRSLLTMSRTSERTVSSKASWLPNHTFTHFFTNSRSQRKAFPDSFTWSCSQTSGEIERDHLQLLLHNLQISEVPSQGAYKYVGSDQAAQENHRNKRGIGHDSVTGRSPKKVSGSITAEEVMNIAMETGPRRTGLMINSCFVVWAFLLFKKAASSNKHHIRSVQVGSQRMSIKSDFFSSPAKLKMAWVFSVKSFSWIHFLSKNTRSWGRQNSIAIEVAKKPKHSDQRA